MKHPNPIVKVHDGIHVVRDDLYPGGTKARYLSSLFASSELKGKVKEIIYASPVEGFAQVSMAWVAKQLSTKKTPCKVTIFTAARAKKHARTLQAEALGANMQYIRPGYLSVVQKRALEYAEQNPGAYLVPFGGGIGEASEAIAKVAYAALKGVAPKDIWCASGSGTLASGLLLAFPKATLHVVEVGRELDLDAIRQGNTKAKIIKYTTPYEFSKARPVGGQPFEADNHYDSKAWDLCVEHATPKKRATAFWCVAGLPPKP